MGLDLDHVLSDSRHHGAFICAICQSLTDLDCLVTTTCSHCFCRHCLPIWLDTKRTSCPTCNRDLLYSNNNNETQSKASMVMGENSVMVQPLKNVQPLAHRLLRTIAVKCPLRHGVACQWEGDYSDLQTHLLSSTAHEADDESYKTTATIPMETDTNATQESVLRQNQNQKQKHLSFAASLKEEANGQFATQHYREATSLYTKAISVLNPYEISSSSSETQDEEAEKDASQNLLSLLMTLYSNRAATYLQMQDYNRCLDDCNHVLQKLDATNVKVYVRGCRALIQLGQLVMAQTYVQQGLQQKGGSAVLQKEERRLAQMSQWTTLGKKQLNDQQYAAAKSTFASLLKEAPSAISFLLGAAQADLGLGLTDSALRLTKRILMQHAQNPQGCWVRGQAVFLMGDAAVGIQLLHEALRLDPDSKEIKQSFKTAKMVKESMESAQKKVFSRNFKEAVELLTFCVENYKPLPPRSPLYAELYTQRAQASLRLKQYKDTLKDCALVLYAQEDHIPAWLVRFQAHHGLDDHETAMSEVKDILSKFPQEERLRKAYERADFLLRKQNRVDFYKLLAVSSISSEMEIKKAYKRKALELHPDKLPPGSSEEVQKRGQLQFQLLGEGFEILCDDFMRRLYDEGYDPDAIRQRVEAANQAAHQRGYNPHQHH
jgi:DnaJ family protein C protein 7